MGDLQLKDMFPTHEKFTFLVGAGCSKPSPSNLPLGKETMEAIINHTCAKSEVDKILGVMGKFRFEQLMEIVRDRLDPDLSIIDYFGLCNKPNPIHFFLAQMMKMEHFVMTTNFDYLIEYALLQSKIEKKHIIPVITKEDFKRYKNPDLYVRNDKFPIYKIHGSSSNIITNQETRKSLIATIQAFGSGKRGESVFLLEPFKRPFFENVINGRTLIIMGYSGSDDFDIVPSLKLLMSMTKTFNIVWIDHNQNESLTSIEEITEETEILENDRIGQILLDLSPHKEGKKGEPKSTKKNGDEAKKEPADRLFSSLLHPEKNEWKKSHHKSHEMQPMGLALQEIFRSNKEKEGKIIRIKGSTLDVLTEMFNIKKKILVTNAKPFEIKLSDWLKLHISQSNTFLEYYIPNKIYEYLSMVEDSERCINEILSIAQRTGDKTWESTALNNLGTIFYGRGKLDEGIECVKKAMVIDEKFGYYDTNGTYLNNLGMMLNEKGDYKQALKFYKEALEIAEEAEDLSRKATRLNNISGIFNKMGELDQALMYMKEALRITEQLGDLRSKATYLNNLSVLLHDKGDLDLAQKNVEEALEIAEQLGDLNGMISYFGNFGGVLKEKGEYKQAGENYKKGLALAYEIEDSNNIATHLNNIGHLFELLDGLDQALDYYLQSLEYKTKGEFNGTDIILLNIARIYFNKEEYAQALRYYEEILILQQKMNFDPETLEFTRNRIKLLKTKLEIS